MDLLEAVHRVNVPRAAALLFRGADVNVTDNQGVTPLIIACERGEIRMVDLLLEAKASTKMVTSDTQSSCLHIAAKNNAAEIVERLLKADPSIEERPTCQGDTALMLACLSAVETGASEDTLTALLQPTVNDAAPKTYGSSNANSKNSVKEKTPFLGSDDPRLRARNRHGHTALHAAAFAQSPTAVRKLLEAGADCTVVDKAGRTAMTAASEKMGRRNRELREGPRGGSGSAAACLRLLQERWAELEKESQERENRLLGELDGADGGTVVGSGKGRRGNTNGVSVAGGAKVNSGSGSSSSSKKKKKNRAKSSAAPASGSAGAPASSSDSDSPNSAEAGNGTQSGKESGAVAEQSDISAVATKSEADERTQTGGGLSMPTQATGNLTVSDTEGETDDETGSHPSSEEAENRSPEHSGDEMVPLPAHARSVESPTVEDRDPAVGKTSAGTRARMTSMLERRERTAHASSPKAKIKSDEFELAEGSGSAEDGAGVNAAGDGESWSVVARPMRKKKTTTTTSASPLLPKSVPQTRGGQRGVSGAAGGGRRDGFNRQREWASNSSMAREQGKGSTGNRPGVRGKTSVYPASTGATRPTLGSARAPSSSAAAGGSAVTARTSTVLVATPVASQPPSVPVPTGAASASGTAPPASGREPSASSAPPPLPSQPNGVARPSGTAPPPPETTNGIAVSPSAGAPAVAGTEQKPLDPPRRPLNVNANAWTPQPSPPMASSSATFVVNHHQQPPTPFPPQTMPHGIPQQHQAVHVHQINQTPPHPQFPVMPQPLQQAQLPRGGTGVPDSGARLPMQIMPAPATLPLAAPLLPPQGQQGVATPWGQHQSVPASHFAVPLGNGGGGFGGASTPVTMQQTMGPNIGVGGVSSNNPISADSASVARSLSSSPAQSLPALKGVLDQAQAMLEAYSPQAAVVALKVEHLVWDVEAMSAGLSMGQLDTLKAFLSEQVARVDEAKLEQVRVQERSKSEEQTNILQNLQKYKEVPSREDSPPPANTAPDMTTLPSKSATVPAANGASSSDKSSTVSDNEQDVVSPADEKNGETAPAS